MAVMGTAERKPAVEICAMERPLTGSTVLEAETICLPRS